MDKQQWLDMAEVWDALRVVPKFLMLTMWVSALHVGYWYMYELLPADRTPEVSIFVGVIAAAVAKAQDYYFRTGRNWTNGPEK